MFGVPADPDYLEWAIQGAFLNGMEKSVPETARFALTSGSCGFGG